MGTNTASTGARTSGRSDMYVLYQRIDTLQHRCAARRCVGVRAVEAVNLVAPGAPPGTNFRRPAYEGLRRREGQPDVLGTSRPRCHIATPAAGARSPADPLGSRSKPGSRPATPDDHQTTRRPRRVV